MGQFVRLTSTFLEVDYAAPHGAGQKICRIMCGLIYTAQGSGNVLCEMGTSGLYRNVWVYLNTFYRGTEAVPCF